MVAVSRDGDVTSKKRKRPSAAALDPLTAWGEAFMSSIEDAPRTSVGSRQRPAAKVSSNAARSHESAPSIPTSAKADVGQTWDEGTPTRRKGAGARKRAKLRNALAQTSDGMPQAAVPRTTDAAAPAAGVASDRAKSPKSTPSSPSVRSQPLATTKQHGIRPGPSATQEAVEKLLGMPAASSTGAARDSLRQRPPTKAEQRRFMSGDVSSIRSGPQEQAKRRGGRHVEKTSEEDAEFNKVVRDVLDWVNPQLDKKKRQQYEEARIRALGGTLEKRVRQPYKMLQEHRKNADATREKKLKEEQLLGVKMNASNHRAGWAVDRALKQKKQFLKDKKARREDGLLRLGMGGFEKRGLVTIPQRAIRAAENR